LQVRILPGAPDRLGNGMTRRDDPQELERPLYEALIVGAPQMKVTRLILRVVPDTDDWDHEEIDEALSRLIHRPDIEPFGDIHNWRHSEIRRI
jgi:hypothetical protein